MRKIILIIVLILSSLGASAQISNVKTTEAIKTITRFRYGLCSLDVHDNIYSLALHSTNQFDGVFIFYLGEGRESALQTLLDLQELFGGMKTKESAEFTITIKGKDFKYRIFKPSKGTMLFRDDMFAGSVDLTRGEIETLIDRFASFELE